MQVCLCVAVNPSLSDLCQHCSLPLCLFKCYYWGRQILTFSYCRYSRCPAFIMLCTFLFLTVSDMTLRSTLVAEWLERMSHGHMVVTVTSLVPVGIVACHIPLSLPCFLSASPLSLSSKGTKMTHIKNL